MATPTDLIGTAEVTQILGVTRRTVWRMIDRRELLPLQKMPGRTGGYLFHRSDVEALITEQASA